MRLGLDRAILVDQFQPKGCQRGAAAMTSADLRGDDRLAKAIIHIVDQEPCPAV
jgi:hypothetical protein